MDRFRELTTFLAVAEEQAFNAAARRLNLSPSVVTRLVNELETRIGARLFTRTTRSVVLTEAGERLQADAARILDDLAQAEAVAAGAHQVPRGILRVTGPVMFGQRHVMPIVRDYLDTYPDVSVTALFLDRIVHLVDEAIDVALRIGRLEESSLYAKHVATVRRVAVASPGYLEHYGTPQSPSDLTEHTIINTSHLHGSQEWTFVGSGRPASVRFSPRLNVNTIQSCIDGALAGWGITRVLSYQVADDLKQGRLVEVLKDWDTREIPVQLVSPDGPKAAAKTRAFVDMASQKLKAEAQRLAAL